MSRVAVVTGAARGLGKAYALRLADTGIKVAAVDVDDCGNTVDEVRARGAEAIGVRCDVSSATDVSALAEQIDSEFGRCDILINNAAIFSRAGLDELSFSEWGRTMEVNLNGMFFTCRAFVSGMRARSWGRVINVSSTTVGLVMDGCLGYVTSKAAIIGFTRALASEVGPDGITVNAIMPGLTRTEATVEEEAAGRLRFEEMASMQPIHRTVETDDVADVVAFLASDDSRMMTGQTVVVDGGVVRH